MYCRLISVKDMLARPVYSWPIDGRPRLVECGRAVQVAPKDLHQQLHAASRDGTTLDHPRRRMSRVLVVRRSRARMTFCVDSAELRLALIKSSAPFLFSGLLTSSR